MTHQANNLLRFIFTAATIVCFASFHHSTLAQTTDPTQLENLTEAQKQAEAQAAELSKQQEKLKTEIEGLQTDLVKTTAQSRGFEKAEAEARAQLEALQVEEKDLRSKIEADNLLSSDLLAALQRIERKPPPALLVSAESATDAARAASLIAYLTDSLTEKTELMKMRVTELEDLRKKMDKNRKEISANASEVSARLRGIKSVISNKSVLNSQLDKDRKQKIEEAEKLASEANNLRELIRSFEDRADDVAPRLKPDRGSIDPNPQIKPRKGNPAPVYIPPSGARFADTRGSLPLPVFGTLSKAFGARTSNGGRAKGVSLRTAKLAQVVAPFPGRIEFSGDFNDDNVVILNVGSGYFIVMTGLGETFAQAGDDVKGGEPLGTMPGNNRSKPELFMEFRKDRSSIDPAPWIGTALAAQ
jgi:septal ring factor EnvC (AmiA/AmiB activator)